jgi:hypothetical protein
VKGESIITESIQDILHAQPTQYASNDVWVAMEGILERLDGTYAMTTEAGDEVKPEDMHNRRVEIMCGIVKKALDIGRERGLHEADTNLHNVIYGIKDKEHN